MLLRGFSIFFLAVYTLVLFQPLVPMIDYVLHKEYIAKNLCENRTKKGSQCNGKCHLAKELKKAGQAQVPGTPSQKNSSSEETVVHINSSFRPNFQLAQASNVYVQYARDYTSLPFEDGIERPPCA